MSLNRVSQGVGKEPLRLREVVRRLLVNASRDSSRLEFLREACDVLREFSGCEAVELRLAEAGMTHGCRVVTSGGGDAAAACGPASPDERAVTDSGTVSVPDRLLAAVLEGNFAAAAPFFTRGGSFWTGDTASPILIRESPPLRERSPKSDHPRTLVVGGEFLSLALIPVPLAGAARAVLSLGSRQRDFFDKEDVQLYEAVAELLGVALGQRDRQWALRERVKELTCLAGVGRALQEPGLGLDEALSRVVDLLPASAQYPESASARVVLDDRVIATAGFRETPWRETAGIVAHGRPRGTVELVYGQRLPDADEAVFLAEERSLLAEIARLIGWRLERP